MFNAIEANVNPQLLSSLTASRISYHQSKMRDAGRAETTIKGCMGHLKAALNWAKSVGMIHEVPVIKLPKRAKSSKVMKGRPITGEEFERMLEKVSEGLVGRRVTDDAVRRQRAAKISPEITESWRHYLRGLWWSGLRLEESLAMTWDDDSMLRVDLSGKYPMLHIPAELEKGNQDRLMPIAPEFAEFLLATPESDRTGFVFNPLPRSASSQRLGEDRVGRLASLIGKRAGVKVSTTGKVKYASAHDLRRSFGERWAPRVMPNPVRHGICALVLAVYKTAEMTGRHRDGREGADADSRTGTDGAEISQPDFVAAGTLAAGWL